MRIATNRNTWKTATIQTIGTMILITIGNIKKMFDNIQTATNYITSLGYQF